MVILQTARLQRKSLRRFCVLTLQHSGWICCCLARWHHLPDSKEHHHQWKTVRSTTLSFWSSRISWEKPYSNLHNHPTHCVAKMLSFPVLNSHTPLSDFLPGGKSFLISCLPLTFSAVCAALLPTLVRRKHTIRIN